MRFGISSGPGAFLGDSFSIASRSRNSRRWLNWRGIACWLYIAQVGGWGLRDECRFKYFRFQLFVRCCCSVSVGMNDVVGVVSMYFFTFQIVVGSASFTNVLHVSSFAFLIIFLSFRASFHSSSSPSEIFLLQCLFLILFTSFRFPVSSSFHNLLLNGHVSFRGVEH